MPRAPKKTPAPTARPNQVDRGEGSVATFLCLAVHDDLTLEAEVEVIGPEGGCITLRAHRGRETSEVLVRVESLRDDEWRGFVELLRAAIAERDRLMPAVALVHEGLTT
jgi:hypothetical protein